MDRRLIIEHIPRLRRYARALQGVLNQVVRDVAVADERARVAPQPGDVLDDEATIHLQGILACRWFFRERFARREPRGNATLAKQGMPTLPTTLPKKREPAIQTRGLAHLFRRLPAAPWNSAGRDLGKHETSPRYSQFGRRSGGAFSEGGK